MRLHVSPQSLAPDRTLDFCNQGSGLEILIDVSEIASTLNEDYPNTDITVFKNLDDALLENNPIITQFQGGPFSIPEVYYRVETQNACAVIGRLIINALPSPDVNDETLIICPNEAFITLNPGSGFSQYDWSTGEASETLRVDTPGIYTVTVYNEIGCSKTATYDVQSVPPPTNLDIVVEDFASTNSITISLLEPDRYQYTIDGVNFQESPIFNNVPIGLYQLQIWESTCLVYEDTLLVGGAPKYFTPNADGIQDTWQLVGRSIFPNAQIYIFDRYGQLLKQFSAQSAGWDGTYLGKPMPQDDYWYRIALEDGREITGHFTLKRSRFQ